MPPAELRRYSCVFDVTQARNARIAAQFGWRHTEKDCRAILINVIKNVSAHVKAQAFAQGRLASATSSAAIQSKRETKPTIVLSPSVSMGKTAPGSFSLQ